MSLPDDIGQRCHDTLVDLLPETDEPVAVLLSGGVDSTSIAAAAVERYGADNVLTYTFMLDGVMSSDASRARRSASALGTEHRVALLTRDGDSALSSVVSLIRRTGLVGKADIEAFWPVAVTLDEIAADGDAPTVLSGCAADGYFALSREAAFAMRREEGGGSKEWVAQFARTYFAKENPAQIVTGREYAAGLGLDLHTPYVADEWFPLFAHSWDDLNRPRQKMPIRYAWPRLCGDLPGHVNRQLGDSQIAEFLGHVALTSDYNVEEWVNPVGVYREIARQEGVA